MNSAESMHQDLGMGPNRSSIFKGEFRYLPHPATAVEKNTHTHIISCRNSDQMTPNQWGSSSMLDARDPNHRIETIGNPWPMILESKISWKMGGSLFGLAEYFTSIEAITKAVRNHERKPCIYIKIADDGWCIWTESDTMAIYSRSSQHCHLSKLPWSSRGVSQKSGWAVVSLHPTGCSANPLPPKVPAQSRQDFNFKISMPQCTSNMHKQPHTTIWYMGRVKTQWQ